MPKQHTRMVGGVSATRDTAKLATAAAECLAHNATHALRVGPSIYHVHGLTVVIYPKVCGTGGDDSLSWAYDIIDPKHLRGDPTLDQARWLSGSNDRSEAMARAVNHAAQWAWNPGVADDVAFVAALPPCLSDSLRAELARWIAWQRRAAAIVAVFAAAGCNTQAMNTITHRLACESRTIDEATTMAQRQLVEGHISG